MPVESPIRVGLGWDAHRLVTGRPLMLGCLRVPHTHGLLGHSDGDVVAHAIADALLGAAGKGDIGSHFPAGDKKTKDMPGSKLLQQVAQMLEPWEISNIDAVILCESPRLAEYISKMRAAAARALGIFPNVVGIKPKNPEQLGPLGTGDGIAAEAVALLTQPGLFKRP